MRNLNIDKLKKLTTGEEHLSTKYGTENTDSRKEFKESSLAFYYGEILKERRKALRLTQEQLAQKVGKERSYIARIEKGKADLRLSNFVQIINALGLNLSLIE